MENLIWITGCSSGIGYNISKLFAEKGFSILATSRNNQKLALLKKDLPKNNVFIEKCDVTNYDEIKSIYKKYSQNFIFDGIINNAGVTSFKSFTHNNREEIDLIINTNLLGTIYLTNILIPHFISVKKGKIFNILSVAATKIFTNSSIYAASKSGLLAFSNVVREEVREHNISVTNILPGATATPIWSKENLDKFSERMMNPKDLAEMICNLYLNSSTAIPEEITVRPILGDL
ncbi:MAG TPA: SDR family NAD(P)-dependent oxidoreductase [Melioribacteraceae bacterium]|nr:SDR family NAD(P)-dependent oxidoreductase [Melioribacteraceae bacterium]